jgi:uncharacterized membrane-anchored protein
MELTYSGGLSRMLMEIFAPMVSRWFRRAPSDSSARIATRKVPELTVVFWVTKALINGASEWWPDFLYGRFGLVAVTGVLAAALVAALALQLSVRRYHASIYWLAFTVASVAAKEAANGLHRAGLPYVVVAVFWLIVLAGILEVWRASRETMSPGSVSAPRQELFYWSAVGSGFALSQAIGHASVEFGFTYLRGELAVVAALTAVVAVAWCRFGLNPVIAFWLAFVLTYPLGGGVASWLAAGRDTGGLGLGRWPVSMSLAAVVLGLVVYMAATSRETSQRPAAAPPPAELPNST